jgi:hypothetical protein
MFMVAYVECALIRLVDGLSLGIRWSVDEDSSFYQLISDRSR